MTEPIIFLDVHGPLQPARVFFGETVIHDDMDQFDRLDPLAVDCIKKLVNRTGAKIVMNSTLNKHGEDYMSRLFTLNGYPEWGDHIHRNWKTSFGDGYTPRDLAIKVWLRAAERRNEVIDKYVIIDDTDVGDPYQVLIDFDNGITVSDYQKAIKLLGGHDSFIIY